MNRTKGEKERKREREKDREIEREQNRDRDKERERVSERKLLYHANKVKYMYSTCQVLHDTYCNYPCSDG